MLTPLAAQTPTLSSYTRASSGVKPSNLACTSTQRASGSPTIASSRAVLLIDGSFRLQGSTQQRNFNRQNPKNL
jgi:hypothetical protein